MLILICLAIAAFTYFVTTDYTVNSTEQFDNFADIPILVVTLNATATTFSAQNQIAVSVIAIPSNVYPNNTEVFSSLTQIFVGFVGATPAKPIYNSHGEEITASLALNYDRKANDYRGSTTLVYPQEGTYCVLASASQPFAFAGTSGASSGCSGYPVMLTISSADSLYQLQSSKASLALAWVLLALTVIFLRDFGENFYQDISLFWQERHQNHKTDSGETHS
jgi:hypothetical protein